MSASAREVLRCSEIKHSCSVGMSKLEWNHMPLSLFPGNVSLESSMRGE